MFSVAFSLPFTLLEATEVGVDALLFVIWATDVPVVDEPPGTWTFLARTFRGMKAKDEDIWRLSLSIFIDVLWAWKLT